MTAGLQPLRDDRITAMLLEPDRLLHRSGRRQDSRAGRFHAADESFGGEAEMEAHDIRFDLLDERALCRAEGINCDTGDRSVRPKAELGIVGR
jgi:hypothetical protein